MTSSIEQLVSILTKSDRLRVPVYQRRYTWTPQEVYDFFGDIRDMAEEDRETRFFGTLILHQRAQREWDIVDGQQRLITFVLLCKAISNQSGLTASGLRMENLAESFVVHNGDAKDFAAIMRGDDGLRERSCIISNFNYLSTLIAGLSKETLTAMTAALSRAEVNALRLIPQDDAQGVFNSLNSTGVKLSEIDLVRNLDLMTYPADKQEDMFERVWMRLGATAQQHSLTETEVITRALIFSYPELSRAEFTQYGLFHCYRRLHGKAQLSNKLKDYLELMDKVAATEFGEAMQYAVQCMYWLPISRLQWMGMHLQLLVVDGKMPEAKALQVLQAIDAFVVRAMTVGFEEGEIVEVVETAYTKLESGLSGTWQTSATKLMGLEAMGKAGKEGDTPLDERVEDFCYALFKAADKAAKLDIDFLPTLGGHGILKEKLAEYIMKCSEVKLCRKRVSFEGARLQRLVGGDSRDWRELFEASGWDYREYEKRYLTTIANYIMVEDALDFDNTDPEKAFAQLHKSQYSLTRGAKKNRELTEEYMAKRLAQLTKLAGMLWPVPKLSMQAAIRAKGDDAWFRFSEVINTKGLKPKGLRVGKKQFSEAEIKLLVKNWKSLGWLTTKTVLENTEGGFGARDVKRVATAPEFRVDGEPIFSTKEQPQYVQVAPGVFMKLEATPGKIVKQITLILSALGCLDEVFVKLG